MAATTLGLLEEVEQLALAVDDRTVEAARVLAEDFLGVAVAGSRSPEGETILRYARGQKRSGHCSVAGHRETFDPATAALITGTSGYAIGLTDTHTGSITHPGPSIVPAALAIAQETGASGRDFLTAVVLGCEVVVRIGSVVNPSHRARGYHPTATCNVFGSAVAAGHLLGLNRTQLANALGIAGSMSGGIYEFRHEGSMLMAFHGGWPAHNGVTAAYLARDGFTGPTTVLEGPEGFFRAFSDSARPDLLAVDFGHPGILDVGLRPYNACRYGHSGVDALADIARRATIDPADVERLVVWTHKTAVDQETEPTTVIGARLSTKFTVAYALVHGPKVDEVTATDLTDPAVVAMIDRTEVLEDPELTAIFPEKWACRVQVVLKDGSVHEAQVDIPKGEPGNPMTELERQAKFRRLVEPVLGIERSRALETEFATIATAAHVQRLGRALAGQPPA